MNYDQISDDGHMIYPEAATMETRKVKNMCYRLQGAFWAILPTVILFMFLAGWFIGKLISQ